MSLDKAANQHLVNQFDFGQRSLREDETDEQSYEVKEYHKSKYINRASPSINSPMFSMARISYRLLEANNLHLATNFEFGQVRSAEECIDWFKLKPPAVPKIIIENAKYMNSSN
jgi:hypothetical protein